MITLKKIETLKPRVRIRKIAEVFHLASVSNVDESYLHDIYSLLFKQELLEDRDKERIAYFWSKHDSLSFDDIYYALLSLLGETPADWDNRDEKGALDASKRLILPHTLYLDRIRSPFNVGSIFRSAESFGVDKIILAPGSASPLHPRAQKTSKGTVDVVDWSIEELESNRPIFALELGGEDISRFKFPKDGICIIGSEESGISPETREKAEKSCGLVSIPLYGAKGSINVSSALSILLYKWCQYSLLH